VPHVGFTLQANSGQALAQAIDKAARKIEDVRSASGANLVYAGYPYDPYA
jgi:hypothetical protein